MRRNRTEHPEKSGTVQQRLSRRRIVQSLGASGVAALAGCSENGETTDSDGEDGIDPGKDGESTATDEPGDTTDTTTVSTPTDTETRAEQTERSFPDEYYQGPLVSAHEHFVGEEWQMTADLLDRYLEWMDQNRVAQTTFFAAPHQFQLLRENESRLVPFLTPFRLLDQERDRLAEALRETQEENPFIEGFGEFPLYLFENDDGNLMQPNHPTMPEVYDLAAELELPVMVHGPEPFRTGCVGTGPPMEGPTVAAFEEAFEYNRETTFHVHASFVPNSKEVVAELFQRHPNFYYDLSPVAPYAYDEEVPESDVRSWFGEQLAQTGIEYHATQLFEQYDTLLQEHSERVMWGMDAGRPWHFSAWAYDTWVDVVRALLGKLPEANARNIAYRTAEEALDITVDAEKWEPA